MQDRQPLTYQETGLLALWGLLERQCNMQTLRADQIHLYLMCSQGPESKLHALFINAGSDVNEPCALKFVVQRSVYCHKLYKTLLKQPAVWYTTRKRRTVVHVQFSLNVICPLCLQAWLVAVSWLDDEFRPAVAQMIPVLIKTGKLSLCFLQIKTFQ